MIPFEVLRTYTSLMHCFALEYLGALPTEERMNEISCLDNVDYLHCTFHVVPAAYISCRYGGWYSSHFRAGSLFAGTLNALALWARDQY